MKVTLESETQKYTAEDGGAVTWYEALDLMYSALLGMYPYLNETDVALHFAERSPTREVTLEEIYNLGSEAAADELAAVGQEIEKEWNDENT